jgi:DNA-binding NarL/FixJ family response regulator
MCLPIFILEDHKYVTDIYIRALRSISVKADIVISYSLNEAYKKITDPNLKELQLAILDYSMPPCQLNNLRNGEDIAKMIRAKFPEAKIIFVSAILSSFDLESLLKNVNPEGIVEKSDIDFSDLTMILTKIIAGEVFYSAQIHKTMDENNAKHLFLDALNLKIIELLSQGIATKNLPNYVPLSLSGVHKRKAKIKSVLNIDNGSDEAIIKEARKKGFI